MRTFVASPEIDSWQDLAVRFRLNFWLSTRAISANLYNDNGDGEDDDVKVMTMIKLITMTMMMMTMTITMMTMMMDITILLNIRLHYNFTKNRLDLTISKLNIVKKDALLDLMKSTYGSGGEQ